jgi:hypothetical protein
MEMETSGVPRQTLARAGRDPLPARPAPAPDTVDAALLSPLCAATAAIARLDERLRAAAPPLRQGWQARAAYRESLASLRLEDRGPPCPTLDLLLLDRNTLGEPGSLELGRAKQILDLWRSAASRHPRQLFTPRRLMAAASRKFERGLPQDALSRLPLWLQERAVSPDDLALALQHALAPDALARWKTLPPLLAAADLLARWHDGSAAGRLMGGAAGRVLATQWLRRSGFTACPVLLPALGFLGHAWAYRPQGAARGTPRWRLAFAEAALRAAEQGMGLLRALTLAAERLHEAARARRQSSVLPALADLLVQTPALLPSAAAKALDITPEAARALLIDLRRKGLIREITGRLSFRVFDLLEM